MLGLKGKPEWEAMNLNLLAQGHQIGKAELLFEKIEDEVVETQLAKLQATKKTQTNPNIMPAKDTITFDEFQKMDIRIGKVLDAEPVPKTDKLLKMTIDTGLDRRTVVSGIAEHYTAEEMVGRQVTILVNLAPRKIRGVESQGMILMAENAEGKLALVSSDDAELMNGSTVA
jgi:methionyl-tRNA synthetase